ncbi:helix-turn-helix transcriptional regulator [Agrococcus casei]|uniref:Putative DeoR-family transcriptional regulator n=1 Tax=Agrococcus casei LMG 22410 TaxID=1255656 RepID=A0A1R4FSM3_9MICO|nr:WYL domain-containing protein [Agrococcus casei]SJM58889.1 Putative DeoR-family transcriptional regulator [Agrococcus casei LMG 22410]
MANEHLQRHMALFLALVNTQTGLTKHELYTRIHGYDPDLKRQSATDRKFERDKKALRQSGLTIQTVLPHGEIDNKETRYRIDPSAIAPLEAMSFDSDERFLIASALRYWQGEATDSDSRMAEIKMRANPEFSGMTSAPVSATGRAIDPALRALRDACDAQKVVRFDYQRPGSSQARERRVEAWAVVYFDGRWLFTGRDLWAEAPRTFLLRRILSDIVIENPDADEPAFDRPVGAADSALADLRELWQQQTAVVSVVPGSDADMRLRRRESTTADGPRLSVHYSDLELLADELTGYANDVTVLEPERLRDAVAERLQRIASMHSGAPVTHEGAGDE